MIKVNPVMEAYMAEIMSGKAKSDEHIDNQFNSERLQFINKSVKNGNVYIIDKHGLIIRKNEFNNKKSAYGWVYDESGDPINIHIDTILLKTQSPDITALTIQRLQREYPTLFKSPRGILYRIYTTLNLGATI